MKSLQNPGTPAAWESTSAWCADNDDGRSAASTFEFVLEALESRLKAWLELHEKARSACYFRGDLLRDKTQYLEIQDWTIFTPGFLLACKAWLNEGSLASYRIAIPTSRNTGQAVIIYPSVIRIWRDHELALPDAVAEVLRLISNEQDG